MRQFIEAASMLGDCHITLSEIHEFQSLRISKYLGKVLLEKTFSEIMAKRLLPHCLILESAVPFWWSTNIWLHLIVDKQCIAPSILLCSLQVAKLFHVNQSILAFHRIPFPIKRRNVESLEMFEWATAFLFTGCFPPKISIAVTNCLAKT
jgi:hypothetical protein